MVLPELIFHMLKEGEGRRVRTTGLPADAMFRGFAHNYYNNTMTLFFEHHSFEPVPEHLEVPLLEVTAHVIFDGEKA